MNALTSEDPHKLWREKISSREKVNERKSLFIKRRACVMAILNPELLMRFSTEANFFHFHNFSFQNCRSMMTIPSERVKALNCTEKSETRNMTKWHLSVYISLKWKVGRFVGVEDLRELSRKFQNLPTAFVNAVKEISRILESFAFVRCWCLQNEVCRFRVLYKHK